MSDVELIAHELAARLAIGNGPTCPAYNEAEQVECAEQVVGMYLLFRRVIQRRLDREWGCRISCGAPSSEPTDSTRPGCVECAPGSSSAPGAPV